MTTEKNAANNTSGMTPGKNTPKTIKNNATNGMPSSTRPTNTATNSPIPPGSQQCVKRPKPQPSTSVTPRLVFGYLRMEEPDEAEIARLRDELAAFCLGQGFHLGGVFCDRGVSGEVLARIGFSGALDALRMPESYALVVPNREHLSPDELVERALVRLVNRLGCRVLSLPTSANTPTTTEAG